MAETALGLRVEPTAGSCRAARERIVAFCRSKGVGEDDIAYLVTAIGEALSNAIEHGGASPPVSLKLRVLDDRVVALIQDAGIGFRTEPSLPVQLPAPEAERGRGLAIMRRCSDIFSISSLPGGGTAVTIGRYRRRPEELGASA
jgi:anti-sigma regulatory factor (Ser/Thr protein kinase)